MFTHLKIRTGMAGVLLLFTVALLYSVLTSWWAAMRSFDQIDELSRTSKQIDGINNAFLLAIRASANVSSAFIETVGSRFDAAEARETRSNSVTAREWELALPSEISDAAIASNGKELRVRVRLGKGSHKASFCGGSYGPNKPDWINQSVSGGPIWIDGWWS